MDTCLGEALSKYMPHSSFKAEGQQFTVGSTFKRLILWKAQQCTNRFRIIAVFNHSIKHTLENGIHKLDQNMGMISKVFVAVITQKYTNLIVEIELL